MEMKRTLDWEEREERAQNRMYHAGYPFDYNCHCIGREFSFDDNRRCDTAWVGRRYRIRKYERWKTLARGGQRVNPGKSGVKQLGRGLAYELNRVKSGIWPEAEVINARNIVTLLLKGSANQQDQPANLELKKEGREKEKCRWLEKWIYDLGKNACAWTNWNWDFGDVCHFCEVTIFIL